MKRYNAEVFTSDFITYIKGNINAKIDANNTSYEDSLLSSVDTSSGFVYFNGEQIDQLRAGTAFIYDTPRFISVDSMAGGSMAIKRGWRIAIAFSDNTRGQKQTHLQKALRYEAILQQLIQEFFKQTGYCNPEINSMEQQLEITQNNSYRFILFDISFTIAGA
jgi:hypothetical protein